MSDDPKTTTILTIDLPPELGRRLRTAVFASGQSLNTIAVEALERWLESFEAVTSEGAR